jgi:hypothetical protein
MSVAGVSAVIVLRAREIRAHGEGPQVADFFDRAFSFRWCISGEGLLTEAAGGIIEVTLAKVISLTECRLPMSQVR